MTSPPPAAFELHLEVRREGETAAQRLAAETGFSKRLVKQTMTQGAVWLTRERGTRRLRRASAPLRSGDTLHLYYDPKVLAARPPAAQLIADEGGYSVWFKPCGMLSQGSKWGDHCTVQRWSEQHLEPRRSAFVVHRLDRAASGLILVAHSRTVAGQLSRLLRDRALEKRYRAIVHGAFPANDSPRVLDAPLDGRDARTHVQRVDYDPGSDRSLLDVRIETGRKHQIRRHLSGAGFPIVGDRLHGKCDHSAVDPLPDLQLTAASLSFECPLSGDTQRFELPAALLPLLDQPPPGRSTQPPT